MEKARNYIVVAVFAVALFGFAAAHMLIPDAEVSWAERRRLKQPPEFSVSAVLSGEYMPELEEYLLDQFPMRNALRTVNAAFRFSMLRQSDVNGIYLIGGSVFKMEGEVNEDQVIYCANKINSVVSQYLEGHNVWYALIPDKNYYARGLTDHPAMDYELLVSLLRDNVTQAGYIDLFSHLCLKDYYRTDSHWRQERLDEVVSAVSGALGVELPGLDSYEANTLEGFYGVYYGQSALPVESDTLTYLTCKATESAVVTSAEIKGELSVYAPEKLGGMDGYDVYLHGAQAVLTIENSLNGSGRELIIFRDSFGSSLAPLLLEGYSKITLVDLRYISSALLKRYVDFADADALFLYGTALVNSGMLLK